MADWKPPFEPCGAWQDYSFARESTIKRWPTILTGIIDALATLNHGLSTDDPKLAESKTIIASLGEFLYGMRHDRVLLPIEDDGQEPAVAGYNAELKEDTRWFSTPWLFAECYLYRWVRALFGRSKHLNDFDPFASQKIETFRSSGASVATLSESFGALVQQGPLEDQEKLHADFLQMMYGALWGNATDLSLLTSLTHEQIQELQSVERGSSFILKNDLKPLWEHVSKTKKQRIDIVLDNAGWELFTDLVLADFFVTLTPFAKEIVFHPKTIPWFVSDTLAEDYEAMFLALEDPSFFPETTIISDKQRAAIKTLVARWRAYFADGSFRLSVPLDLKLGGKGGEAAAFWTSQHAYAKLPFVAPELLSDLQKASLVVFKGDLNYRKLTSDAWWPATTPFEEALGPLKGKLSILSLRTCKADVAVGMKEGQEEKVKAEDPNWRINGKYALISFSPRDEA